jgi:hypothetical protein
MRVALVGERREDGAPRAKSENVVKGILSMSWPRPGALLAPLPQQGQVNDPRDLGGPGSSD